MVLRITDDFISSIRANNVKEETRDAINIIARGRKEGKHLIISSRENISFLLESELLNKTSSSVFSRVFSNITQYGYITNYVSHIIDILPHSCDYSYIEGNPSIVKLPIEHFADTSSIQSTLLLTENLDDANLYKAIAGYYMSKENINAKMSSYLSHGGGNNISDQYRYQQSSSKRFIFCIVDSDKKHPMDSLGNTASSIARIDDDDVPYCYFHVLDAHEIENLLPSYFVKEAVAEDSSAYQSFQGLSYLHNSENVSYLYLFADVKEGTTFSDVLPFIRNMENDSSQLDDLFNSLEPIDDICTQNLICMNEGTSECSCIINNPAGEIDITSVINCLQSSSFYELNDKMPSTLDKAWSKVGRLVFSWLCSTTRLRV